MNGTSNKRSILCPSLQVMHQSICNCSEAKLVAWFSCWIVTEGIPEEGECSMESNCTTDFHSKGLCRFGLWLKDVTCPEFSIPMALTRLLWGRGVGHCGCWGFPAFSSTFPPLRSRRFGAFLCNLTHSENNNTKAATRKTT